MSSYDYVPTFPYPLYRRRSFCTSEINPTYLKGLHAEVKKEKRWLRRQPYEPGKQWISEIMYVKDMVKDGRHILAPRRAFVHESGSVTSGFFTTCSEKDYLEEVSEWAKCLRGGGPEDEREDGFRPRTTNYRPPAYIRDPYRTPSSQSSGPSRLSARFQHRATGSTSSGSRPYQTRESISRRTAYGEESHADDPFGNEEEVELDIPSNSYQHPRMGVDDTRASFRTDSHRSSLTRPLAHLAPNLPRYRRFSESNEGYPSDARSGYRERRGRDNYW